jgi:FeS assembly SUF system protein
MSDPNQDKHLPLNVLNTATKVEELKRLGPVDASKTGGKNFADRNVIDRALDVTKSPRQKLVEEKVIDALRTIYDPEIPVNVYDLGLIYAIDVDEESRVSIRMTLTAPGCPMADMIVREVETKTENVDEVRSATVQLVFDPPWSRERMSEAAMLELGLL